MQDELALNLYDFDARMYDPYTWRTPTIDEHSEFYAELSPYSFLENNPINMLDPTGMDAIGLGDESGFGGQAICETCPKNDPRYQPFIDDKNNNYHYDEATGNVSLLLNEVTVTDNEPQQSSSIVILFLLDFPTMAAVELVLRPVRQR